MNYFVKTFQNYLQTRQVTNTSVRLINREISHSKQTALATTGANYLARENKNISSGHVNTANVRRPWLCALTPLAAAVSLLTTRVSARFSDFSFSFSVFNFCSCYDEDSEIIIRLICACFSKWKIKLDGSGFSTVLLNPTRIYLCVQSVVFAADKNKINVEKLFWWKWNFV